MHALIAFFRTYRYIYVSDTFMNDVKFFCNICVYIHAGIRRCRRSCRLRWVNNLKPTIKRGDFEEDEIDLVIRLQKLLGNRQMPSSIHIFISLS